MQWNRHSCGRGKKYISEISNLQLTNKQGEHKESSPKEHKHAGHQLDDTERETHKPTDKTRKLLVHFLISLIKLMVNQHYLTY